MWNTYRLSIISIALLGGVLISVYFFASINVVILRNLSGQPVPHVSLRLGATKIWSGNLDNDNKKIMIFRAKEEGAIEIEICQGANSTCEMQKYGYITGDVAQLHSIDLVEGGKAVARS